MDEEDKEKINRNRIEIVGSLIHGDIVDHLINEGVFNVDDEERINAQPTQKDKNRTLVKLLLQGKREGYQEFLNALEKDEVYKELAQKIQATVVEKAEPNTLESWIGKDRFSSQTMDIPLSDQNLMGFSKAISISYLKQVAVYFNFSSNTVESILYTHPRAPESACMELLIKWKNRTGHKATVRAILENLFKAAEECPNAVAVDQIRKAFDKI